MQPARMAQIRRDYDIWGSSRNPRRDFRPTARSALDLLAPLLELRPLLGGFEVIH